MFDQFDVAFGVLIANRWTIAVGMAIGLGAWNAGGNLRSLCIFAVSLFPSIFWLEQAQEIAAGVSSTSGNRLVLVVLVAMMVTIVLLVVSAGIAAASLIVRVPLERPQYAVTLLAAGHGVGFLLLLAHLLTFAFLLGD